MYQEDELTPEEVAKRLQISNEEARERLEHRDILMHVRSVLLTDSGKRFFRYLLKNLEVGTLPNVDIIPELLRDKLGFLRAGNSVFQLLCEADPEIGAQLFAQNEKERHAKIYLDSQT